MASAVEQLAKTPIGALLAKATDLKRACYS